MNKKKLKNRMAKGAYRLKVISGKSVKYLEEHGYIQFNDRSGRYRLTEAGKRLTKNIRKGKVDKTAGWLRGMFER